MANNVPRVNCRGGFMPRLNDPMLLHRGIKPLLQKGFPEDMVYFQFLVSAALPFLGFGTKYKNPSSVPNSRSPCVRPGQCTIVGAVECPASSIGSTAPMSLKRQRP